MFSINFINLILSFSLSLMFSLIIMNKLHFNLKNFIIVSQGPQKIHHGNISRLGGLSIFLTILVMAIIEYNQETNLYLLFVLISMPVFVCGFFEDITQSVSPKIRLLGSVISGVLFIIMFDIHITNIGIHFVDIMLNYKFIAILFTVLCITYLIQAFNIIDGLNGLCLTTAIISFLAISKISFEIRDFETFYFLMSLILVLIGVLIFNFPFGKIFIGDSGAYILGLYVSIFVITLAEKNANISPFVIAQILIYPSYELLRTLIRRIFLDKINILNPDNRHLHSMLYLNNIKEFSSFSNSMINSLTSLQIIFIQLINLIYIINFYDNEKLVIIGIVVFIIVYEFLYNKLKKQNFI